MSPQRIDKVSALERIESNRTNGCVPCELARKREPLARSEHAVALLSRYPIRWGHVLIVLREHVIRLEDVSVETWTDASRLAHAAGRAVERAMAPTRCYVAMLGTGVPDLAMTFPHLHFHVIPVAQSARPAEVLTWKHGVYEGSTEEWTALQTSLIAAWPAA